MSFDGKGPARIPARRRAIDDATIGSPWFGPPELGGRRPWILTFVGFEKSFVDLFFEGVFKSGSGYHPGAFPPPNAAEPATPRKLYLPIHRHFHIVTCQINGKRPAASLIEPKRVLETGAVVRRFIDIINAPPGRQERWADWIASPLGDGIWSEIAKADMTPINGVSMAIDPADLPQDVLDGDQLLRLGVHRGAKLKLTTSALQPVPPRIGDAPLGEVVKHTAWWGFLPVTSSEKERAPNVRERYDTNHHYAVWCYAKVAGSDRCEEQQLLWSQRTDMFSLAAQEDLVS